MTTLTCIVCPKGCKLTIEKSEENEKGYVVSGNQCKRGQAYAITEMTAPTRVVTSTVVVKNGLYSRLPVKTSEAIPKGKMFDCMKLINKVSVTAPISCGDIIIDNLFGLGINLVATRDMPVEEKILVEK